MTSALPEKQRIATITATGIAISDLILYIESHPFAISCIAVSSFVALSSTNAFSVTSVESGLEISSEIKRKKKGIQIYFYVSKAST